MLLSRIILQHSMRLFVKTLAETAKAACTVAFHNILIKASCIWMSNSNICHVQLHTPNCLPEMGLFNPFSSTAICYTLVAAGSFTHPLQANCHPFSSSPPCILTHMVSVAGSSGGKPTKFCFLIYPSSKEPRSDM